MKRARDKTGSGVTKEKKTTKVGAGGAAEDTDAAPIGRSAVRAKDKALEVIAEHPVMAEVVAAALVATAAALKNPEKARQLAESAADEITAASKSAAEKGGAIWQLALDIARRSADTIAGADEPAGGKKPKKAAKTAKNEKKAGKAEKPAKKKKKSKKAAA